MHLKIIFYIVLIYMVNTISLYHDYPVFLVGFAFYIYIQTFGKRTMQMYSLFINITIEVHFGFVLFSLTLLYYIVDKYIMKFMRRHIKIGYDSIFVPIFVFYLFFVLYLYFYFNIDKQILKNIAVNLAVDMLFILVFVIILKQNNSKARR